MSEVTVQDDIEMKGWLYKWTNFLKGYQKRWFVLSKGVLRYYRKDIEMSQNCRGTMLIQYALVRTGKDCNFAIINGRTQTLNLKADSKEERQSWITAIELAKAKTLHAIEYKAEDQEVPSYFVQSQEVNTLMRDLTERLETLRTCYDLVTKQGVTLQRILNDLKTNDEEALSSQIKLVTDHITLFRITSNAMVTACSDYQSTAKLQSPKWSKIQQNGREEKPCLEEDVEQLTKQQS